MRIKKNILLTGSTGFTGEFVLKEILVDADKYNVSIFVRDKTKVHQLGYDKLPVNIYYGSFEDENSLDKALEGQDNFINVASLGFGHAKSIINSCNRNQIRRAIFISTTSIFTKLNSKSKEIRIEAEEEIKESGMKYTIIRPTMIYGTKKDRNMSRLIRYIQKYPVIPVFGTGQYLQQPVFVEDLAGAIVKAMESEKTINKAYNISGRDALTYDQIIKSTAIGLNRKIYIVHIPVKISVLLVSLQEKMLSKPILKVEQILRLNEKKSFSYADAQKDFGYKPLSFKEGISKEIKEMSS